MGANLTKAGPLPGIDEEQEKPSCSSRFSAPRSGVCKEAWEDYLKESPSHREVVAKVEHFRYAPLAQKWTEFAKIGLKVEVPNPHVSQTNRPVLWVGNIVCFAGYKALIEFEVFGESSSGPIQMWINFCSTVPKHLGYCFEKEVLLYPVLEEDTKNTTYMDLLLHKYFKNNNMETISRNHVAIAVEGVKAVSSRFKIAEIVEATSKTDCSRLRLATITGILADRVHISYIGVSEDDEGFIYNQNSSHIHKVGWYDTIGAKAQLEWEGTAKPEFPPIGYPEVLSLPDGMIIKKDMLFEMVHPYKSFKVVPGYVVEVFKHGYFLAGTDWTRKEELVHIIVHVTSDYVLPLNFCRDNRVEFEAPNDSVLSGQEGQKTLFSWREYCARNKYEALDLSRVKKSPTKFLKGNKFEATKVTDCLYTGPVTVVKKAGHLIRLHFDGYSRAEESSFQWVSSESPDIYPAGYSEMVGHRILGAPQRPNYFDDEGFKINKISFVRRSTSTTT